MAERGFGRLYAPDARDSNYPMRATLQSVLPPGVTPTKQYRYYPHGPILDQGNTGTCGGFMGRYWLNAAPRMTKTGPDGFALYRLATLHDEWAENDNDPTLQFGTSVRGVVKALQSLGHVERYVWAASAEDCADWILADLGGVMAGTLWLPSMSRPNPKTGVVKVDRTQRARAGHAYFLSGYSRTRGLFRSPNSWGRDQPKDGVFWMAGEDLQWLLERDGEACAAQERRVQ